MKTHGIHHVTAIAGPAGRNVDFYTRVLGMRLVKKTVNFDDPGSYHLYYGDEAGSPGTILTFFPWEHAASGRLGVGEAQETVLRVPEDAIGWWIQRLIEHGVAHDKPVKRFGETVLAFRDPDGMRLALAAVPGASSETSWPTEDIPADVAIRGFHSVSLLVEEKAPTAAILTGVLGFSEIATEETTTRYAVEGNPIGGIVDIRAVGGFLKPRFGAGSVHHIAFRAADDDEQAAMVRTLAEDHGIETTEQRDRNYFRSVYFREPGHVLFEIATDVPGFDIDEPRESLGEALKLPAGLEAHRETIEAALPAIAQPAGVPALA
ncbi:Possible dioxygenase/glyoxalase family protein [Fulvimarina pelagi HTCC2506]|uniref:Possible dioxygenase/glyoxalase family protein n=1 Tax=Fulvimarina pelagi HTCC2506 TaxID=314231 RepID=Q0G3X6_9HYPH|nr:ring-cleaving dioxygenase [Fulvimarina pelagi]EAU41705.1 Possible dioxygenase/glyoxalase family protein [Fulvimarina pelagi HTCC2506]